jgi:6-phospho-3-hexuloisomerase
MIRALAMRLFHLGYEVSVAGDMTAPFLTNGDLLILSVGPGYVATIDALRSVAQGDGATVVCLTVQTDGKTSHTADEIVYLPAQIWRTTQRVRPLRSCRWAAFLN